MKSSKAGPQTVARASCPSPHGQDARATNLTCLHHVLKFKDFGFWRTLILLLAGARLAAAASPPSPQDGSVLYTNDVDPRAPMSCHIIKVSRSASDVRFCTTFGKADALGMDLVSEQLKTLPPDLGQVVAAINGDFYHKIKGYEGRPRDVQIRRGEVVSSPSGYTSFWIDTQGQPQMTNITSRFRVVWPNGKVTQIGLNQYRTNDTVVLYTAAVGRSTRASGGVEYRLDPLRPTAHGCPCASARSMRPGWAGSRPPGTRR